MIRYVPSSAASELTEALWNLARPEETRTPSDTQAMFGFVDDLQTPSHRWLEVDTDFAIIVHPAAGHDGIADILQPWIDAGQLPASTNSDFETLIISRRGQTLVIYDSFPQIFKDLSKTREEMIASGLLAEPDGNPV